MRETYLNCESCGAKQLYAPDTWIGTFPGGEASTHIQCGHCGVMLEVPEYVLLDPDYFNSANLWQEIFAR